jgi:hypothetical protein
MSSCKMACHAHDDSGGIPIERTDVRRRPRVGSRVLAGAFSVRSQFGYNNCKQSSCSKERVWPRRTNPAAAAEDGSLSPTRCAASKNSEFSWHGRHGRWARPPWKRNRRDGAMERTGDRAVDVVGGADAGRSRGAAGADRRRLILGRAAAQAGRPLLGVGEASPRDDRADPLPAQPAARSPRPDGGRKKNKAPTSEVSWSRGLDDRSEPGHDRRGTCAEHHRDQLDQHVRRQSARPFSTPSSRELVPRFPQRRAGQRSDARRHSWTAARQRRRGVRPDIRALSATSVVDAMRSTLAEAHRVIRIDIHGGGRSVLRFPRRLPVGLASSRPRVVRGGEPERLVQGPGCHRNVRCLRPPILASSTAQL